MAGYVYPSLTRLYTTPFGAAAPFALAAALEADGLALADRVFAGVEDDVERHTLPGGSVAEVLHRLARSESAALLAVGATHRGPVGRAILGSSAEQVVHGSPCPVLVVPQRDGARLVPAIGVPTTAAPSRAARCASPRRSRCGSARRCASSARSMPKRPASCSPSISTSSTRCWARTARSCSSAPPRDCDDAG